MQRVSDPEENGTMKGLQCEIKTVFQLADPGKMKIIDSSSVYMCVYVYLIRYSSLYDNVTRTRDAECWENVAHKVSFA